jgi:hypothetical protein
MESPRQVQIGARYRGTHLLAEGTAAIKPTMTPVQQAKALDSVDSDSGVAHVCLKVQPAHP